MKFKEGNKVVIVRSLGERNGNSDDEYYYGGDTGELSLKTKGVVKSIDNSEEICVELKNGEEWSFHPDELKLATKDSVKMNALPEQYVFNLASQMPIFLINDRVYTLGEPDANLKSNFLQISDDNGSTKRALIESATLSQLEELTKAHNSGEFNRAQTNYLKGLLEDKSDVNDNDQYKLLDFIVNEVFPHFRKDGGDSRVAQLLGAKEGVDKEGARKAKTYETDAKKNPFISKLIDKVEKEKFKRRESGKKKLDSLLGYDYRWDFSEFPKNYEPNSLLGKILEGRNVAVVDNIFYNLVQSGSDRHKKILNLNGKEYILFSPKPFGEVKERYDFELSKVVKIDALNDKLTRDSDLSELAARNADLASLARKQEYKEGDFGFIKEEYNNDGDYSYWVFLQVPKHVMKMPDDYDFDDGGEDWDYGHDRPKKRSKRKTERYYLFDKVRVAVKVYIEGGKIYRCDESVTVENYNHPFAHGGDFGEICLGDYHFGKLNRLEKGEAVARLLVDTRQTFTSGYVDGGTTPIHSLEDYEDNRITLSEAKRRNIPVTNVNLGKHRRQR